MTGSIVQPGNQQFILKTSQGSIQLTPQQHLQLQQQLLQQQQQQQQQPLGQFLHNSTTSPASTPAPMMSRSITPNSASLTNSFNTPSTQTATLLKRASPAPNVNIVHLPTTIQQPQQQQQQQQQQFQIAPGAFLQIPYSGAAPQNFVNTALIQGSQAGTLVNTQNTVIQNPNVVNVNVAAPHILCNNSTQQQQHQLQVQQQQQQQQQQQRHTIGIPTQNPFNIQGTLIQTAEGKSILIPSQNMAQPINIQQLSVATPVGTQPIQQSLPTTIGNMIQFAPTNVDNRTNQGMSQIMVNAQGQQILVQRSAVGTSQPQNIIVRTQGGQSNVIQLPQRPAGQAAQIQAQPLQQALSAGGQPQFKLIGQSGNQTGVPMVNIGGQNITLQQLTSQLGNIQGLQFVQQQQQQTQQQQVPVQQPQTGQVTLQQGQSQQVTFQPQQQVVVSTAGGQVVMSPQAAQALYSAAKPVNQPGSVFVSQASLGTASSLTSGQAQQTAEQVMNHTQLHQSKMNTAASTSVEQQTQQILQRISNQLQMSQANAAVSRSSSNVARPSSRVPTFSMSNSQTAPNVNIKKVKLEPVDSTLGNQLTNGVGAMSKSSNILESLVKQEPRHGNNSNGSMGTDNVLSQAASLSGITRLLANSGQTTVVTTTVSQASTAMSMLVVSNSSLSQVSSNTSQSAPNTIMSSFSTNTSSFGVNNGAFSNQISVQTNTLTSVSAPAATSSPAPQLSKSGATLQTIHLPPDLQQQFQRVQLEIKKVNAATNISTAEKHTKLQQLQIFQRKILLKGRVLATTKAEPHHIQQSLAALTQSGLSVNQSSSVMAPSAGAGTNSSQQVLSSQTGANPLAASQLQQNNSSLGQQASPQSLATLLSPSSSSTISNQAPSAAGVSSHDNHNLPVQQQQVPAAGGTANAPGTNTASQVAVPTQIKVANKVLTLNLTPALRDKITYYLENMTFEQQQQYLQSQQHVIQRLQKQKSLNSQIMAQVEHQKKQAGVVSSTTPAATVQPSGQGAALIKPLVPQTVSKMVESTSCTVPEMKSIPVPTSLSISESPQRGLKRNLMDIPKATLIHQQIRQDQNHAVNADTKRAFRSRSDACRRLLRFHVFQSHGPTIEELDKFDRDMEDISLDLLQRKDSMMDRFRELLVQETVRSEKSSELVMLQRMQNQDLRKTLEWEKELVHTDPESFEPMPMKFLCKEEKGKVGVKTEANIKEELSDSDDYHHYKMTKIDRESPDTEVKVKSEPPDHDYPEDGVVVKAEKMKKLVIKKSNGQMFQSSFKRASLDSMRSSMDEDDMMDTTNGSVSNEGTNIGSVSTTGDGENRLEMPLGDEDEDTNDYSDHFSSLQDEAAAAAMVISSAEDSQDSPGDDDDSSNYRHYPSASGHVTDVAGRFSLGLDRQESGSRGNFELAEESVYFDENQSHTDEMTIRDSYSKVTSSQGESKYIPNHSPVSNDGDVDSRLSGNNVGGESGGTYLDNLNMYQPITESLTDSEENSYYSADNAAETKSVIPGSRYRSSGGGRGSKSLWTRTAQFDVSDSEGEEDPEVKAQMESAINSILSLSQGVSTSEEAASVYDFSQSENFINNYSQSNYSIPTIERQGSIEDRQPNMQMVDMLGQNGRSYMPENETNSDLESAVNSIL